MNTEPDGELFEAGICEAIRKEYALAQQQARVPPPEVIWLYAEMRAREEAARTAVRPILIAQGVGVAAFAGLLVSVVGQLSLSQLPEIPLALVEVVVGGWLVLGPVALYLAFGRD